ncbi:MAG: spore cortex-lytic enzyme [Firmicutes bacterium]|nr:spore cortex-lytic enzyme [Bacillota bacterium]
MRKKVFSYILLMAMIFSGVGLGFVYSSNGDGKAVTAASFSVGSSGLTVRRIQQQLKDWGYLNGDVDGVYGSQTAAAVRLFQQNNGLTPDGIVGTRTLEMLGIAEYVQSDSDLYILASAIYGEGRGEPYEGQVAIGAVILNRVKSSKFPNTIAEVVYQKGAFDAVADGQISLTPNETAFRAAQDALNGWDPTGGAIYYWNPATATSQWIWTVPITTQIGRHVFGVK